ncbi:TPA: hypothetical protein LVL00_002155 [Klebsiella oxytoca]|nr:hypothetical protein [Klebsiella oxytoca]
MKQQPAKCAVDEWGNLVNAEDFRSPSFWKLHCFHCCGPVISKIVLDIYPSLYLKLRNLYYLVFHVAHYLLAMIDTCSPINGLMSHISHINSYSYLDNVLIKVNNVEDKRDYIAIENQQNDLETI